MIISCMKTRNINYPMVSEVIPSDFRLYFGFRSEMVLDLKRFASGRQRCSAIGGEYVVFVQIGLKLDVQKQIF